MKPTRTISASMPVRFRIEKLHTDIFDVQISENIEAVETTVKTANTDKDTVKEQPYIENTVTQYEHDLYVSTVNAANYDELIAGIIHTKLSVDDEIALTNKGIADKENAEYVDYRNFVADVKEIARKYFSNEE